MRLTVAGRASLPIEVALACLVFAVAFCSLAHPMFGQDPTREVLVQVIPGYEPHPADGGYTAGRVGLTDHRFVVWLVSRNARILLSRPWDLFEAECCFPTAQSLATAEPAISLGLLGTPAQAWLGDPIATFNFALFALTWIAAMAMYALVRSWTRSPAAALVAALLYAFHALRISDASHVYVYDTGWIVLALLFASRLFESGHWRDAVALSLCGVLQIAESFYPLLAAVLIAAPFALWAALRYGLRNVRPAQLGLVAVSIAAAAVFVMTPYLELREQGTLASRGAQVFRPLSWILPGRSGFAGWLMTALVALVLLPMGRAGVKGLRQDPRLALGLAAVLTAALALHAGGVAEESITIVQAQTASPWHPYSWLAWSLPGFEVVRGPGAIYAGTHLLLALLAGIGAAALLRALPTRSRPFVAAGLVALAYVDTLRPESLGFEPRVRYQTYALRPAQELIDFFDEVAARAQPGPLLELPYGLQNLPYMSRGVLLAAYHQRVTSQCYNPPPASQALEVLTRELPDKEALAQLAALGFRSIVVHNDIGDLLADWRASRFLEAEARDGYPALRRVYADADRTAYDIVLEARGG